MTTAVIRNRGPLPFFNPLTLILTVAAVMIGAAVLFRFSGSNEPMMYLSLLAYVQLTPVVLSLSRRHLNYISFIMGYHFLTLSFPKYIEFTGIRNLEVIPPIALLAMYEQALGSVIIIAVYTIVRLSLFREGANKERFQPLMLKRTDLLLLGGVMALMPILTPYLPPTAGALQFLTLSVALIMVFTCIAKESAGLIALFKFLALVLSLEHFLRTGMLSLFGMVMLLWGITSFMRRSYGGVAICLVGVLIGSAVQSVKADFRVVIYEDSSLGLSQRFDLLTNLLAVKFLNDSVTKDERSDALVDGMMRVGDDSLERVLEMTPSEVPFWEGETYVTIPTMFIPRIIWPDKPERNFWNKYGRTYKILSSNDFNTSVGVGYLAEAYMNFGYTGLYLVAALVGALIAGAERMVRVMIGDYYLFAFVLPLTALMMPGNDLGSLMQSLWMIGIFIYFLRIPLKKRLVTDPFVL